MCRGRNKGLRWDKKGSRANEENKRLRGKVKGADSAQGEGNKMHEGEKNVREK